LIKPDGTALPIVGSSDTSKPKHKTEKQNRMKKLIIPALVGLLTVTLLTGCVGGLSLGGGTKTTTNAATVGQQMIDLKKARDAGAITDAEYQAQKIKILSEK
jgi:hypothetical protein